MRCVFLVNDTESISSYQTTAMLIQAAVKEEYEVHVTGVNDLSCNNKGIPLAFCRRVMPESVEALDMLVRDIEIAPARRECLIDFDMFFIRTNPARDRLRFSSHEIALQIARLCQQHGVFVMNKPEGLVKASNKLYLLELPEKVRPVTLISHNVTEIQSFIKSLQSSAVIKPLEGTRGNDVFIVSSVADKNLNQILQVVLRQGAAMIQEFVPGAEKGDTRVILMEGQILQVSGRKAAIRRIPGPGDFRSNIHVGGHPERGLITPVMKEAIDEIGPKLVEDGLLIAGLDFIGDKIIEVNVFSPGGFRDAERFERVAFSREVIHYAAGHIHET